MYRHGRNSFLCPLGGFLGFRDNRLVRHIQLARPPAPPPLVVKIKRKSPTPRESFQSLARQSKGSKRLILSTRLSSLRLIATMDYRDACRRRRASLWPKLNSKTLIITLILSGAHEPPLESNVRLHRYKLLRVPEHQARLPLPTTSVFQFPK
jgi:hypothetical protein